jgi:hypothetical protein
LIWDVGKKGTTTVKISLGQYPYRGDLLNIFKPSQFNSLGELARLDFFWMDDNLPAKIGNYDLGAAAGKPYYLYKKDYVPTIYTYETTRPDYAQKYYGFDIIFEKRMTRNWMVNGSLTLQKFSATTTGAGVLDPTNERAVDGNPYANNQPRWMFKLNGVYRLPFGFNAGVTLFVREGFILQETVTITDLNAPNSKARTVIAYFGKYGDLRMKPWIYFAIHLEKAVNMGGKGKVYFMLDLFNVTNLVTVTARQNRAIGTYYPNDGSFVPNVRSYQPTQIFDPQMLRRGVKFQI